MLYPFIADYWNSIHQSQAIAVYMDDVTKLDDSMYDALWEEAQSYNALLLDDENRFFPNEEDQRQYDQLLSISDDGIIGYVEITSIDVTLPIYHGTSEEILQVPLGILRDPLFRWEGRARTVLFPDTGDFHPPDCSQISISLWKATPLFCRCWVKL